MKLSLILCSRNDAYMGNSRWRLETTLNYLGERIAAIGRCGDVEVIVADWGSEEPLRDAVRLSPAAAQVVLFVTIPPALARERQGDSPFPEVLALNAAARRARGAFIGRIDQDTLVGGRALRWMLDMADSGVITGAPHVAADAALFFANRRNVPYRFAAASPDLRSVSRFVRLFGSRLTVSRQNADTGDLFWTSYVGIWLAHRNLWQESGGYDERLIYYNWMEAEMIRRLRHKYPVIDAGELTHYDFFHLEHLHPRAAWFTRRHARRNAAVDVAAAAGSMHPNDEAWGLSACDLNPERTAPRQDVIESSRESSLETSNVASLTIRVLAGAALDRVVIPWTVWRHRFQRVREEVNEKPVARWPQAVAGLWEGSGLRKRVRAGALKGMTARILAGSGGLAAARRARLRMALASSEEVRAQYEADSARFAAFSVEYGNAIGCSLADGAGAAKRALVVSSECPTVESALWIVKALQLAGFTPVVLLEDERKGLRGFYELAGVEAVHLWSEFLASRDYSREASTIVERCGSIEELMRVSRDGVRIGMIAVCTALRRERVGVLDLTVRDVRDRLARYLATSLASMEEARAILRAVRPGLVLTDPEYTPKGELFDASLEQGLDVIAWDNAHRSNALIFKRYGCGNRERHLTTLAPGTWAMLQRLDWSAARRERLGDEVVRSYQAGDWFGTPWTSTEPGPEAVRTRLGLDPAKKSAFVFPHMLWDAPVMWGKPIFSTYQEWFVETVKAACRNDRLNWVIKIHPAHVWKRAGSATSEDAAELRVIRRHVGVLPPHVHVLPSDTPVSTYSLFPVMDYCLTVRGTVGVEAARLGIPVLTAGPARYSELGFTVDSSDRAAYLAKLARIDAMPPLSAGQRELAERFAYGLFLLRPLTLTSVAWDAPPPGRSRVQQDRRARITVNTADEWRRAADVGALADWLRSTDEDFLNRPA